MFRQIRSLLAEDGGGLGGEVEADETYVGGKRRGTPRGRPGKDSHTTPVVGVAKRDGRVVACVTPDTTRKHVLPIIHEKVLPASLVYTDEYVVYDGLGKQGHPHRRVHHAQQVYVVGDAHTNTIEAFGRCSKTRFAVCITGLGAAIFSPT